MLKKTVTIILCTICISVISLPANAADIFTDISQVSDSRLVHIAATKTECIAAAEHYLCRYIGNGWSDAICMAKKGYIIEDITSSNGFFYMLEFSEEMNKNRFSYSADGINWTVISEYSFNGCVGFARGKDGSILVECPADTVLPKGFERYTGSNSNGQLGNFSVKFGDKTISVRTSDSWYSVTDANGETAKYQKPVRDNAIDTRPIIIGGIEYSPAYNYCPFQYKVKEDKRYNVKIGNKYYYMPEWPYGDLYKYNQTTSVYVYEDDENGMLKRNPSGDARIVDSKDTGAIGLDFKYVDGLFYIYCWGPENVKVWKCSSDLIDWSECDEPPAKRNFAETINGTAKIQLGNKTMAVEYEDTSLTNPYGNFVESYTSNTPYRIGDYYYTLDDSYFRLSKDGVYYVSYELPEMFRAFDSVVITEDGDDFVIQSGIHQIRAPKNAVYERLEAESADSVYVLLNDNLLAFEERPVIENGSTLIPIRFLFERMGAAVDWNSGTRTAAISQGDKTITFAIDNTTAAVNGQPTTMNVPARLINNKTMVPLRFLSENLGYTVIWDEENRIAAIK